MENLCATFKLFSLEHFVYILLAIALSVGGVFLFKKLEHRQKYISIVLVSAMGLFVVLEYIGRIIGVAQFNFWEMLPVNTIQVFTIISIIVVVKDKVSWEKFLYLIALPISGLSIIFIPNFYTTLSTFSIATISYVIINICIIIFSIMRMLWNKEDLYQKDVLDALITFVIIVCAGHILNVFLRFTAWGLNADYYGTMAENYNLYIGWVSSVISVPFVSHLPLFALLVGVEYLLKWPFDKFKTKREHLEQMEELVALGNLKAQQKYRESQRKSGSQILIKNNDKSSTNKPSVPSSKESFIKTKSVDVHDDK